MSRGTEKEKNIFLLEKEVSLISAVNNPKLGPYLDVFRHYPENIMLDPLGILSGFFRINSPSEESSYIVNFLSSILKKEYYINPKRAIENSFDSALRKINLALSEIAKEGNIDWVGKIDGAVCVLEKNNLYFSVCGNAKILLFRGEMLSEISKDVAADEAAPNPLKTFVNVSSGRLEEKDKIIICAPDVFEVFSESEIKKGALRLSPEKFTQFLKTGLINKLDIVGTIVIDIFRKKEELKKEVSEIQSEISNVFSRKAFEKKRPAIKGLPQILGRTENGNEYTDEKTGHIYIHEGKIGEPKESAVNLFWFSIKEKLSDVFYSAKNKIRRKLLLLGRSAVKAKSGIILKIKTDLEKRRQHKLEVEEAIEKEEPPKPEKCSFISTYAESLKEKPEKIKLTRNYLRFVEIFGKNNVRIILHLLNKIRFWQVKSKNIFDVIKSVKNKSLVFLQSIKLGKINIFRIFSLSQSDSTNKRQGEPASPERTRNESLDGPISQSLSEKGERFRKYTEKTSGFFKNLIPDPRKIKDAFISLSPKNKLIT
ncbi:MAG: hypothetical protein Q7S18_01615, partial [bacterium]|nr:hypothetical protein [bacterium]